MHAERSTPNTQPLDSRRLARLRWRCRRGTLENDLLLAGYLDSREAITADELTMLEGLLELSDETLWALVAGLAEPDPGVAPLVARLREKRTSREDAR